jgi:hypothetical protein
MERAQMHLCNQLCSAAEGRLQAVHHPVQKRKQQQERSTLLQAESSSSSSRL